MGGGAGGVGLARRVGAGNTREEMGSEEVQSASKENNGQSSGAVIEEVPLTVPGDDEGKQRSNQGGSSAGDGARE